jgi:FkbM family methyltransferase
VSNPPQLVTSTGPGALREASHIPDPANPTARLGRRVMRARWPRQLEIVRSGANKLAWTAVEARLVRSPFRYAFRELVRPSLSEYSLRHGSGRIALRHRTGDIEIFRKFYAYGYYDWPVEVLATLKALNRPLNVVDLGANIGFFEVHTRDAFRVEEVVAFEPDPNNAAVLERVRVANGGNWKILKACASNRPAVVSFKAGFHNLSRVDGDGDRTIPAMDVFPYVAQADLVKMNIEGAEWDVLQDPRLGSVSPVWIVEYHRLANPEPEITALARRLFERAGYVTRVVMNVEPNGLLWAWKAPAPDPSG